MGKKKQTPKPDNSLSDWLREIEQHTIGLLENFNETDNPRVGFDGSFCLLVCGEWRYFDETNSKFEERLLTLSIIFYGLAESFELIDELHEIPSYESSISLAEKTLMLGSLAWQTGLEIKTSADSAKGAAVTNAAHKELHSQYQPAIDKLVAAGNSYTQATEKVAKQFCVTGKTVRNNTQNKSPRNSGGKKR